MSWDFISYIYLIAVNVGISNARPRKERCLRAIYGIEQLVCLFYKASIGDIFAA